jgi:nitrogen fixation NifU-like protein
MALEDLYREIILDHAKNPRNSAVLDNIPDSMAHENPSCGDTLKLEVTLDEDGTGITRIRLQIRGCAISTASASIMSELASGKRVEEARELADAFISGMRGGDRPAPRDDSGSIAADSGVAGSGTAPAPPAANPLDTIDELAAFKGVMHFPVRVKCATLAWHALLSVLPPTG